MKKLIVCLALLSFSCVPSIHERLKTKPAHQVRDEEGLKFSRGKVAPREWMIISLACFGIMAGLIQYEQDRRDRQ